MDHRQTPTTTNVPPELQPGREPLGDALTVRIWLARLSLMVCVVMTVVVFVLGNHPFWHVAFPAGILWSLVASVSFTRRKKAWQELMERRQTVVKQLER
jgi:hypothetical protein